MKQLTCEMCGGTDLIKQDGVFVCQTCGCKYSVEEAKKMMIDGTVDVSGSTVIIDSTQQIENNLKRAKHLEIEGNDFSAMEYYNKVLDVDADNITANEGIKRLRNKSKWSNYFIIEPEISTEKNVKRFLESLSKVENVVCDIYGNIKIKSIEEKYCDFSFLKASGGVSWTAVRCDQHIENETVYKSKYENGKEIKVPETTKVTRVERTPISGSSNWGCQELYFASDSIVKSLNSESDTFAQELNDEFIEFQNDIYGEYEPNKIDTTKIVEKDGIITYNGINVEISTDKAIQDKITNSIIKSKITDCCSGTLNSTSTTYYENIDTRSNITSKTIANILLPVQIIVYEYKGEEYTAISSLSYKCNIFQTIPTDRKLNNTQKEITETKNLLTKRKHKDTAKIFFICTALMPVISAIICFFEYDFSPYLPTTFIGMGLFLIIAIVSVIIDSNDKKKIYEEISSKSFEYNALLKPRTSIFLDTKKKFFENYTGINSVESASTHAKVDESTIGAIDALRIMVDVNDTNVEIIDKTQLKQIRSPAQKNDTINDEVKESLNEYLNSSEFLIQITEGDFGVVKKGREISSTTAHLISIYHIECINTNDGIKDYYIEAALQIEYMLKDGVKTSDNVNLGIDVSTLDGAVVSVYDVYRVDKNEEEN